MPHLPPSPRYPLVVYLRMEQAYVNAIDIVLRRAARELSSDINKLKTGSHPLSRAQLEAQRAAIKAHLNQDWSDIETAVRKGQIDAAQSASKVMSSYENVLLQHVLTETDMKTLAAAEAQRAGQTIQTLLARTLSSHKPLSQQVYESKALTNGWVNELINVALVKNSTAAELARAVRGFISPDVPGGASYAAKRLARTEINNAFHASGINRYQKSGLVDEVDWHLSSSHPEGDECDGLASDSPYNVNNVPEKPHPNCFCFTTPHMPTRQEFIDNLFAGKYGDEPWIDDVQLP